MTIIAKRWDKSYDIENFKVYIMFRKTERFLYKGANQLKNVFTYFVIILCVIAIIGGKLHWNNKLDAPTSATIGQTAGDDTDKAKSNNLATLTQHLPENLAKKIEQAQEEDTSLTLVAMGSHATAEGEGTWTDILQTRLNEAYGQGLIQVHVESLGDDLSITVVQEEEYANALDLNPDIIILEPFILNDNGKVAIDNTLESISLMIQAIQKEVADAIVMLQPPNPIYNAVHYPSQVLALEEYAEEQNIIYLNHWTSWPDYESDDILDYIDEANELPSDKGHQVWGNYISDYFTGGKLEE